MALALIEIVEGRSADEKRGIVEAVRAALSDEPQAPEDDLTVRLAEYPREQFSRSYPDRHSEHYTLISVTMFADARCTPAPSLRRRRPAAQAVWRSARRWVITLLELPMENWGVNGGTPASEIDVGFKVDI